MRNVAFVGIKRKYKEIDHCYWDMFDQYHIEIPFYLAMHTDTNVLTTTVDLPRDEASDIVFEDNGTFSHLTEKEFLEKEMFFGDDGFACDPDVVVHWREWFPEFYKPHAVNILHTCDFGYSDGWKKNVIAAYESGKLYGIDCYPTWHKENLFNELGGKVPRERLLEGHTLGVDADIYRPAHNKDPYQMLWSSDPGRGLNGALQLAMKLFQIDKRFRLHVCWPDYVKNISLPNHPAIVRHGCIDNGPELWDLFSTCGVLPYTSTFPEPSSRAHRQAMAAGSLVLYPPCMGSPSELIEHGQTGIVEPTQTWCETIIRMVTDGSWKTVGEAARRYAVSESWEVQAKRFSNKIEKILEDRH